MLTRVYIDNFRCFVNFEYRPEQKQLLLGANGSGKSSLLDAIRYAKAFICGEENQFTGSTRTRWQDRPLQVIELEAVLGGETYQYRLEIRFGPESRRPTVNLETLKVSGWTWFEFTDGELRFSKSNGTQETAKAPDLSRSALHLSRLSTPQVNRFMEWLDSFYYFRIDAYPGEMSEVADSAEIHPNYEMGNLASWYRFLLQDRPAENAQYLTSMRGVLDGFGELRFAPIGGGVEQLKAIFVDSWGETQAYSLDELSDGQRYLFALYMILHFLITKGHTVFIDEPDNFVALREIQPWLKAAEDAVEDHHAQLILISHHPEILNQWAARHGLRFFRENNGHVRTEKFRPDPNGDLQPSELIARGWEDA
jgi:predicted ATPase